MLARLQAALADRYRIEREAGRGGMATVYLANDVRHDRSVAIKVLAPEIALALGPDRFLREIRIAAQLQHPHILPLLDSGEADGLLYYVMPYVQGESLRVRQAHEPKLSVSEAVGIVHEVVDALAYAHSHSVVHRDIKPDNVLLSGRHALVTDFGVAKAISASTGPQAMTTAGVAIGTPAYMAPEQAAGDPAVDHRADIYAVGVLAYELLTGEPPFGGPTPQAILAAQLTDPPEQIGQHHPAVPPALAEVVMKCLEKTPANRWQSAEQLLRELEVFTTPGATSAVRPRFDRRRWTMIAGAGAVALFAIVTAGIVWGGRRSEVGETISVRCTDGSSPPCVRAPAPAPVVAATEPAERERGRAFLVLPFRNLSGAAEHQWLVEASPTMLADALGQWREVSVVPDERLYPALRRHGLSPGTLMDLSHMRMVAAETGGWTAVVGEVITAGNRLVVSARAFDIVTERLVTRVSVEVGRAEDIRRAYEHIATSLLRGAGLDQATADLKGATTRSLDAYRAYLRATAHLNRSEYRQARTALEESISRDSTFAQAYAKLAEVSLLAFSVLEPDNPAFAYAERAAALSSRLPPRLASHVRALRSLLNADFTAARRNLERLVAQDSIDVEALETLASLEFLDPLLVGRPGRERRRGSLNRAVRLSARVLDLDPTRHGAYQGLVAIYSLAGGQPPAAVAGYHRELPRPVRSSVRAWCSCDFELAPGASAQANDPALQVQFAGPDVMLVPLLRDSLVLIPLDSLSSVAPESVAAWRTRSRAVAQGWVRRWLAAGSAEAEAHRAAARVLELDGAYEAALRELNRADSLGVEAEAEAIAARRMILLGKLGRLDDARGIADSLWRAHYFAGELFEAVPAMMEAYAWATNLFAAGHDFARARAALAAFSARLALRLDPEPAHAATVAALSGAPGADRPVVLPDALRLKVRDALRAELSRNPGDRQLGVWLRTLDASLPSR